MDRNQKLALYFLLVKVALRKESVDRNVRPPVGPHVAHKVALRKESVDRNRVPTTIITICIGRSPQGERG